MLRTCPSANCVFAYSSAAVTSSYSSSLVHFSRTTKRKSVRLYASSSSSAASSSPASLALSDGKVRIMHWNILARYLGRNQMPWFLHGLSLDPARRRQIFAKYYQRDPTSNCLVFCGYPNYVQGILTDEEQDIVHRVDAKDFSWPRRFDLITSHIISSNADIVSIVELDEFDALLKRLVSYDGVFARRPRPVSVDGSSLFWKRDKFNLISHRSVSFIDRYNPDAVQDRCAVVALLETKPPAKRERFLLVSVHLAREVSEPGKELRARQLLILAQSLREFCLDWNEPLETTPVVVCGDINESKLHRLQGLVAVGAILSGTTLHPFVFNSRALQVPGPTSVTEARSVKVDAIFASSHFDMEAVDLQSLFGPPRVIPDETMPSDHFPIVASLKTKSVEAKANDCTLQWWSVILGTAEEDDLLFLGPEDLAGAFSTIDENGDGLIDVRDAVASLKTCGLEPAANQLADNNDWTPLRFPDFCAKFYASRPFSSLLTRAAFESMDSSPRDGVVSETELRLFFQSFVKSPFQTDAQQVFSDAMKAGLASVGKGLDLQGFETFLGTKFVQMVFDKELAKQIVDAIQRNAL